MDTPADTPSWLHWSTGNAPQLILAPHGGRRLAGPRLRSQTLKVNDLHTADVARELAEALDASFIINTDLDRNTIDLNRISQVRQRAPWLLDLVERLLGGILRRHPHAEILVIHGWNVVQTKCDIGIGARLDGFADTLATSTRTISPSFLQHRLRTFDSLLRAAGIATAIGARYPARHPNNLIQLFRHTAAANESNEGAAPLRAWALAGRIEAVQLELGIPLRWPGEPRRRLLAASQRAFASTDRARCAPLSPARTAAGLAPPAVAALRFFDARGGLGLTAAVETTPQGGVHGRVLLFLADGRVALFTGEESAGKRFGATGPSFAWTSDDVLELAFDGFALTCDDGRHYLDLERALSHSTLLRLRADLTFTRHRGPAGDVRGGVEIDGRRVLVAATGFADPPRWRRWSGARRSEWAINAAFARDTIVIGDSAARHLRGGDLDAARGVRALRIPLEADGYSPRAFEFELDDSTRLHLQPAGGRLSILRPVARQRSARVTLGVARATLDGAPGNGTALYEYARLCEI